MKLLLDENLSYRLVRKLKDTFPGSQQVERLGLLGRGDREIWRYAKESGYAIISKDDDFLEFATQFGAPPKLIWLDIGNASTERIATLINNNAELIKGFGQDSEERILILRDMRSS